MKLRFYKLALIGSLALLASQGTAIADVNVGLLFSITGPAAAIGNSEKNGAAFGPSEIAGEKINYILIDEASDTTGAVNGFRRLVEQSNVDIVVGTTTTPGAFAIVDGAARDNVPVISMVPTTSLVFPVDEKKRWIFKSSTNDEYEAAPLFENMKKTGVKRLALIGFSDAYGQTWSKVAAQLSKQLGIEIVADEKYARTDTSVVGQILKITAAKPDAVLMAASGAPAALPVLELRAEGYQGAIYGTLGATFGDFRKLTGSSGEGIYVPLSPAVGAESFPDSYPAKQAALSFVAAYEAKFGPGTANIFAGSAYDAITLFTSALPDALKAGRPGTPEFREGLRTALEGLRAVPGSRGLYNMDANNHSGLDQTALLLGRLDHGKWVLVP